VGATRYYPSRLRATLIAMVAFTSAQIKKGAHLIFFVSKRAKNNLFNHIIFHIKQFFP
jgi:hypothetical protein